MLRSVSSTSDVEQIIKEITSEDPLCRTFYKYSCLEEDSPVNLIMGMGFISFKNGLSGGLPLDCLNMILVAKKIREKLDQAGKESTIHLLLADHMAYDTLPSEALKGEAEKLAQDYHQKLSAIIENLGMQAYTKIHLSSKITQDPQYQNTLTAIQQTECKNKEIVNIRKDDKSHRYYFEQQTAQVEYFRTIHQCKIKISWTRRAGVESIKNSNTHDEAHFDRVYQKLVPKGALSFVYVDGGHEIHNEYTAVPYYAASTQERVLFGESCSSTVEPHTQVGKNILTYYRTIYVQKETPPAMSEMIQSLQSLVIKGGNHGRPTLN